MADAADARDTDVFVAPIMYPGKPPTWTYMDILYTKLTGMASGPSWWWSRTSTADDADAGDENMPVSTILGPRDPLI